MPNITTFDILDNKIKQIGGRPTVLEALWDGDTQGWYLLLYLYTKSGSIFKKKETRHFLGEVSISEGMEHFTNGKWTISELANQFGKQAIEKYKLTFYFPSQEDADDDCPKWTEKHLAIHCADCNKLIIPTDSPYLPKDICYNCHLKREQNERVKNKEPCDDGVSMYLSKNTEYERIGHCTHFRDFTIAPYIADKVKEQLTDEQISIITLNTQDIFELKEKLENVLSQKLDNYEAPRINEKMRRFVSVYKVQYRDQEYLLMDRFNNDHSQISSLISSVKNVAKAISEDLTYKIFFKKGITYRDDTVLRFVNYVCKGSTKISNISNHYINVLTESEVVETIRKLEKIHCLMVNNTDVSITTIGKCII